MRMGENTDAPETTIVKSHEFVFYLRHHVKRGMEHLDQFSCCHAPRLWIGKLSPDGIILSDNRF